MSLKPIKIIVEARSDQLHSAFQAAYYAIHNSDFRDGWALIVRGSDEFAVKRNKAGYSVKYSGPAASGGCA